MKMQMMQKTTIKAGVTRRHFYFFIYELGLFYRFTGVSTSQNGVFGSRGVFFPPIFCFCCPGMVFCFPDGVFSSRVPAAVADPPRILV